VDASTIGVICARHETEAFNVWNARRAECCEAAPGVSSTRSENTIPSTCPCLILYVARKETTP
jgi:hypothetical protein